MPKQKTPVGVVLAYSLTVGSNAGDNVQRSRTESYAPAWASTDTAKVIADSYGAVADKFKTIETAAGTVKRDLQQAATLTALGEFNKEIRTGMQAIEALKVAPDDVQRENLKTLIGALATKVSAYDKTVTDALAYEALPLPVITTARDEVTAERDATISAASFTAAATGGLTVLLQDRDGAAITGYAKAGERMPLLVVAATPTSRRATHQVTVKITTRPISITIPSGIKVAWGTDATPATLGIIGDGERPLEFDVAIDTLPVGPATVSVTAPGDGQRWGKVTKEVALEITRVPRLITLNPPATFVAGQAFTLAGLTAVLLAGTPAANSRVNGTMTITDPVGGVFPAAGNFPLTVESAETATHGAATITVPVTVALAPATITWANPPSAVLGAVLGAAQLNAVVNPALLAPGLIYHPGPGHPLNQPGTVVLAVTSPLTPAHAAATASVRLLVLNNAAQAAGTDAMLDGTAFRTMADADSRARLADWNASDPNDANALGTQGPALMARISTMTDAQLLVFIAAERARPGVTYTVNGGNEILSYTNGLEIRRKANGGINYGNRPTVCMEVRKDPLQPVAGGQPDIAFKVTVTGRPSAKGQHDVKDPAGGPPTPDFVTGALATNHLRLQ